MCILRFTACAGRRSAHHIEGLVEVDLSNLCRFLRVRPVTVGISRESRLAEHALLDHITIYVQADETLLARRHHVRVGDDLPDEGVALVVEDHSLHLGRDLLAHMIRLGRRDDRPILFAVANRLYISLQKHLLDFGRQVILRAVDLGIEEHFVRSEVTMARANLEIWFLEEVILAADSWNACLRLGLQPPLIHIRLRDDLVEAGQAHVELPLARMDIVMIL